MECGPTVQTLCRMVGHEVLNTSLPIQEYPLKRNITTWRTMQKTWYVWILAQGDLGWSRSTFHALTQAMNLLT